ncbi:hypothetical protein AX15_002504 [Amanita polypyramis BW_CC]|nr:hypothetical protein AX15_002504 [Amanita polypyramis BW_CC]
MIFRPDNWAIPELAQEELLDAQDPLRHLMHADVDLDNKDETINGSPSTDYLSVLPRQLHSIKDEILSLTFSHGDHRDPISISLYMDASPGCGGIAWPAGQILSNYIVKRGSEFLQNKKVLELGSGTGLVGLVAGKLNARVWITDQAPLLNIMRKNVEMNHLESSVTVAEVNWGTDLPPDIPHPDIILAADCVYFEPAFPLLVQTLADLADQTTEILFCYKKRRKADKRFFTIIRKHFSWEDVMDDPDRAIYNREAINLLRLRRTGHA